MPLVGITTHELLIGRLKNGIFVTDKKIDPSLSKILNLTLFLQPY
jgi:hypothetical protein